MGTHLEFRDRAVLTLAYVDPLGGHDRQFNGEFRLMFNYFFGAFRVQVPEMESTVGRDFRICRVVRI